MQEEAEALRKDLLGKRKALAEAEAAYEVNPSVVLQERVVCAREAAEHAEYLAGSLTRLEGALRDIQAAQGAKAEDLSKKKFLQEPRELTTGDVVDDGVNEFVFVTPDGQKHTVKEELLQAPYSYVGKMTIAQGKALAVAQVHADSLMKLLSTPKRGFKLPEAARDELDDAPLPQEELDKLFKPRGGFRLLGGGSENNVYLHEPTQMVYKVPHEDSLMFSTAPWGRDNLSAGGKKKLVQRAVYLTESRYAEVEDALQRIHEDGHEEVEYLKTYFLQASDTAGKQFPVVAQPLMDRQVYHPLPVEDISATEECDSYETYLEDKGFTDLHAGNVSYNSVTGKLVLFDCLFVPLSEREDDYRRQGLL